MMDEALLSTSQASHGQLVKMLITFKPHALFNTNFVYIVQSLVCKTVTSIILAGLCIFVKMLITFEPHGIL